MKTIPVEGRSASELLRHCAEESGWAEGDEPLVMISFAKNDEALVRLLRTNLDRPLGALRSQGRSFTAWDYAARHQGTTIGAHFPTEIAEKMWRCRAAVVFWSPDYVASDYCFEFELPFLLWRFRHSGLRLFLIRVNVTAIDRRAIETPDYRHAPQPIELLNILDDRNPALMPIADPGSGVMLEVLMRSDLPLAKARMASYAEEMCRLIALDEKRREGEPGEVADGGGGRLVGGSGVAGKTDGIEKVGTGERGRRRSVPKARVVVAGLAVAAAIVVVAVGALIATGAGSQKADPLVLRRACDAAAASPDDPSAERGVPFAALDPSRLDDCRRALAASPTDPTLLFETGRLTEKAGRERDAYDLYAAAHRAGKLLAANNIGVLYRDRPSLFRDVHGDDFCGDAAACDRRALSWFATADDGHNPAAPFNLGAMYEQRRGVAGRSDGLGCSEADCETKATEAYRRAAALKDGEAGQRVARMALARADRLSAGERPGGDWCTTVTSCDRLAADMAAVAAASGRTDGIVLLGMLYETGRGVLGRSSEIGCATAEVCIDRAIEWYSKAEFASSVAAARLAALRVRQ